MARWLVVGGWIALQFDEFVFPLQTLLASAQTRFYNIDVVGSPNRLRLLVLLYSTGRTFLYKQCI